MNTPVGHTSVRLPENTLSQRARTFATEVDVSRGAIDAEVGAARVVVVIVHAAIARDAAIHLVRDERPEILVQVRAFREVVLAAVMTRHHRHVLQMAMAAFFADRAIVRVIGHHQRDDRGAELGRFGIVDRDVCLVRRRRHARHHDAADFVVFVAIQLDRALATRADAAERRMPAEIRDVEAVAQACAQQVFRRVDFVLLAINVNDRHGSSRVARLRSQATVAVLLGAAASPATNSDRKYFSADCNGSMAPGASGQNVFPGPSQRVILLEHVEVFGTAAPGFERAQDLHAPRQSVATRRAPAAGFARKEFLEVAHRRQRCSGPARPR